MDNGITINIQDNKIIVNGRSSDPFRDAIKISKFPYILIDTCIENKEDIYKQLIIANIYLILDAIKKYNLNINILDEVSRLSKKLIN